MPNVVIAGGGPAGFAAAIALAERGVATTVVDPTGGMTYQRGELLPEAASAIMDRLGLGRVLRSARKIARVDSHWGHAQLQAHGGHPTLGLHGWGVDRQSLATAMIARLCSLGGTVKNARISKCRWTNAQWTLAASGRSGTDVMQADYVIDATGRPAHVGRRQGANLHAGPDLVGVIWQSNHRDQTAMVSEATKDGWWYAVPHAFGRTIGFMTTATEAKCIRQHPDRFLSNARKTLKILSVSQVSGRPRMMDSRSAVLSQRSGCGWLATGDAAAAFDPIASQGLFNALSGGFFAGNASADAVSGDQDAPLVYAALAAKTAEQTHRLSPLQYAAMPYDTPFWQCFANGGHSEDIHIPA